MVESTVNNCHYESVTTNVWMALYRELQGLRFYVWFVGQIIDSNECTFTLFVYYMYFLLGKKQWLFKKF